MDYKKKPRKNRQKLRNFLFGDDGLLEKISLNKKFLELIKKYAVIFFKFLENFFNFSKSPNPKKF